MSKSFLFAIRVVGLNQHLLKKGERVLSKQVLRSGTAIGALIREAQYAESRADFVHKLCIALKEANETCYWVDLLFQTNHINHRMYLSVYGDAKELLRMLIAATKTLKSKKIAS